MPGAAAKSEELEVHATANCAVSQPSTFDAFARTGEAIAGTRSKLEKVRLLAEYLKTLPVEDLGRVTVWFTGIPFPSSENKVLQLGWALLREAICQLGEISEAEFHHIYLKHSDLGNTAFEALQRHEPRLPPLTIAIVDALFHQIVAARGPGAKLPLLAAALRQSSALEAKYLAKILSSDLRIGLKEGLVEEGIARAFDAKPEQVRNANLLLGNIGETARRASQRLLATATITAFRPIKFMLASPEATAQDIWDRTQTPARQKGYGAAQHVSQSATLNPQPATPLVWIEDKYDGIRCQLHKSGQRVALYSRDLKEITRTFPDVADAARQLSADVILDGEILAMRGDAVLPFSDLQKRLGRREVDLFLRDEIPIKYVVFDFLWRDNEELLNRPLSERRQALEALTPWPECFKLARITRAQSAAEIEDAFGAARSRNNEGLIVKDPASFYTPGRRGLAWLKLKKALSTLDCVVVGAEYGHGKRSQVLSDYTFAVRDEKTGELKIIGKAYSGLTDPEIAQLTQHFLAKTIQAHGRYHLVEPDTVLEIAFDRIQPSARHNSGLAMRFPRIVRIRTDKSSSEIDTLATARRLVV